MKTRAPTLVILSPGFPVNEADTVCLTAQQLLIRAIKKNSPQLKIIILSFEYPLTTTAYEWYHTLVIPFNGWNKRNLSKLFIWWRIWKKLRQIKKENQIVGLFSFWCTECALIGKYFGRLHGLRHFCWILGQDARKDNRFIRWIRPVAGELVAMSDFLAKEFYKNHSVRPLNTIPNGIDIALYPSGPSKRDIDVLGAGSLILLKQYDLFIRVIGELRKKQPSIRAMICGKGPENHNLQSLIEKLGLGDNVLLTGEIDHGKILQLMQRSRVFLHSSYYEGFSTVCLEALYAGAHVISFCKPMDGSIPHWHVAGNKEEMLQILKDILKDPATDHQPVLPYSMSDSAWAVMKLFD